MKRLNLNPLFIITLLLCSAFQCVQAEEAERFLTQDSEGFNTSLRNVSDSTVTLHLVEAQQTLQVQLAELEQQVKRKSFKVIDTLITVFVPGGLVYAKLRFDSFTRSKQAAARVSAELDQISGDLVTFQTNNGELVVAVAQ
jgi:hypothetical protein